MKMPVITFKCSKGLSLIEVIISLFVFTVVGTIATRFTIYSSKNALWSVHKTVYNNDLRLLFMQIRQDMTNATIFYVYDDFNKPTLTDDSNQLPVGSSGNCLFLIRIEDDVNYNPYYKSIVIYDFEMSGNNRVLYRNEIEFADGIHGTAADKLEEFIDDHLDFYQLEQDRAPLISSSVIPADKFFKIADVDRIAVNAHIHNGSKHDDNFVNINQVISKN